MIAVQFDLFKTREECEIEALRLEITKIKLSTEKVRKKLFAENGTLVKRITQLEERLEIIERGLCTQKLQPKSNTLLDTPSSDHIRPVIDYLSQPDLLLFRGL